jgi:hypothetical protein
MEEREEGVKVFVVFEHVMHEGAGILAIFDSPAKASDYVCNHERVNPYEWLDWKEWKVQ